MARFSKFFMLAHTSILILFVSQSHISILSNEWALQQTKLSIFQYLDGTPPSCRSEPASQSHPVRALDTRPPSTTFACGSFFSQISFWDLFPAPDEHNRAYYKHEEYSEYSLRLGQRIWMGRYAACILYQSIHMLHNCKGCRLSATSENGGFGHVQKNVNFFWAGKFLSTHMCRQKIKLGFVKIQTLDFEHGN